MNMKKQYDVIFFTNLPSFYKINLYNRISENAKIFVVFTGDTASIRNKDFFSKNIRFEYQDLTDLNLIQKVLQTIHIIRNCKYDRLVIGGIHEITSWVCAFLSPKNKNYIVVESSYHEAALNGWKFLLKTIFFKRISVAYVSGKAQEIYARKHHFNGECIISKGVGIFNIVEQPQYTPAVRVREFVYVGRLSAEKNLAFLISVFNTLPQYRLHIVGYGPLESELKSMARSNIVFHGAVDNLKLPEIYQSSDVFILPSVMEPWGLVVEEALNNGVPVLVSNKVGCAEEIITENYNGLIFQYDSASSLLSKIEKITEVEYYNSLRYNISKMNFNKIADQQVKVYL